MNDEFIEAAKTGDIDKVKLLLNDDRVDPAYNNNYAIQWASVCGHLEIVKLLLKDKRVDPSTDFNLSIRWASKHGHIEIVKLLFQDKRVDPSDDNNFAIKQASHNGHTEVVRLLLQDERVDWRVINLDIKNQIINDTEKLLKTQLTAAYLTLERSSPQTDISGKTKSQIPKEILKQMVYMGQYQELRQSIHNSEIPSVKLVGLANILNIEYDVDNIEWSDLSDKIKQAIFIHI